MEQLDPRLPNPGYFPMSLAASSDWDYTSSAHPSNLGSFIDHRQSNSIGSSILHTHDTGSLNSSQTQLLSQAYSIDHSDVSDRAFPQSRIPSGDHFDQALPPLLSPAVVQAHPRILSMSPHNTREMIDFALSTHDQMVKYACFKPLSQQIARIRESLSQRLYTCHTKRLIMFIGCKVIRCLASGTSTESLSFYKNWLDQLDKELRLAPDWNLTFVESQNRRSGMLELAFIRFRLSNGTSVYRLLLDFSPVFLQIALAETARQLTPSKSVSVSLAHLFASGRCELAYFALLDSLCSMLYAVPQTIDYDTSVQLSRAHSHPVQFWIYGCPPEFQMALADINTDFHRGGAGKHLNWKLVEQNLMSWKPVLSASDGESWRTIARLAVQESWRHTLLIYLYMAVCKIASDDVRVQASVQQIFQLAGTIKPSEAPVINTHLVAQFLIAGACARDEKQRTIARERLGGEFDRGPMILKSSDFLPVLDHLWHGAAANGRPILWSDYVQSRQAALPVVI
ncbi:hypothetical protein FRC12_002804 [Ceratobasidium sp. 428]|nr:hypothetical protein FRC12_002804 [Ceratobasidium sp. 428]